MPVATRTTGRPPPSFIPGQQLEPGFDDILTLSTRHQRFTCVRLTSRHLTDLLRLFRNAHHPSHCAGAACGGLNPDPAIRVRGAHPHLLCSKAAQSWFYIVTSSSRRRGAQSSAYLTMTTSPWASRRQHLYALRVRPVGPPLARLHQQARHMTAPDRNRHHANSALDAGAPSTHDYNSDWTLLLGGSFARRNVS